MTVTTDLSTDPAAERAEDEAARRLPDRRATRIVWALAAGAAALSLISTAAPTGLPVVDALWCAGAAVLLTILASRATRNTWLWVTAIATVASIGSWTAALAAGALVLAAASTFLSRRPRVVGAAVGALSAAALLTLPSFGPFGAPSVVVVVAVVPVLRSGYQHSPRRNRKYLRRAAGWGIVAVVFAGLAAAISAVLAASSLLGGVDSATTGLERVRDGNQIAGANQFAEASRSFDKAEGLVGGPWTWPARVVPVLSQHTRAIATAAHTGRDLSDSAEVAASVAPYRDLKARDGQVDLAQVVEFQEPVAQAAASLQGAEASIDRIRSPWLVAPAVDALDRLQTEVDKALPEAVIASEALDVAPGLLGAEGDRRYLVLFTSPAESRNIGGFTGSYGVLEAVDGQVDITISGEISELARAADFRQRAIVGEDEFMVRYRRYQPQRFFQNLTVSPDMETTANVAGQMYQQTMDEPLDGVIVADPYALAGFLELTGPVQVEGVDVPLTKDNAAEFLLHDQYILYEGENDARKDRLEAAGRATFDALTSRELPTPRVVGGVLGPLVDEKRLMFFPFADDEQALMDDLGSLGTFEVPDGGSDFLSVRTANLRANKADYFLHRDVEYDVAYDAGTGQVDGTVTMRFRNDAPAAGLPDYVIGPSDSRYPLGTARIFASVYTPLLAEGATLDGAPVGLEMQPELGANVFSTTVQMAPGGESTLVIRLSGTIEDMGDTYRLLASSQPLVNPEELTVTVRGAEGAPGPESSPELSVRDGVARVERPWREDQRFSVHMAG